jgi:solute carrier family 39 (zinc transporter), member 1/2/3
MRVQDAILTVDPELFEGLGLGSRLAMMQLPTRYNYVPIVGALLYGITTPLGIAVGLGVHTTYNPGSTTASIVSGVLDSLSAGILIYTGLVEVSTIERPTPPS